MRLIDADDFKLKFNQKDFKGFIFARIIDMQPTIDPESLRPHGRWIKNENGDPACTNCKGEALLDGSEADVYSEFCPHCGAKIEWED
ncbi:MAG: hypothetical protein Q4F79_13180 [Eubacteriales bacterium]|nr:hypothetical protein [Eubacteriales bacterium]